MGPLCRRDQDGIMGWYRPRGLLHIRFAGEKQPGDLPKPTDPLFSVSQGHVGEKELTQGPAAPAPTSPGRTLDEYSHHSPFESRIVSAKLLTRDEALKPVYAAELDVSCLASWQFMPGDAFGILPENDPEVVQFALQRLGLESQAVLQLSVIGKAGRESLAEFWSLHGCSRITTERLFKCFIDWTYFPKKACLSQLAEACEDPLERLDLLYLASRAGSAEYLRVAGERTTILDFLHTFPSCKPSLELLLRHLPLLHPRFYSISSSRLACKDTIEFLFNTIEYRTPEGYARKGLCSAWIEDCIKSRRPLKLLPRPNGTAFRPPIDPSTPIVMVCAGTGISPFIGFLRHWRALSTKTDSWLFYGFRHSQLDYLFRAELDEFLAGGTLSSLSIAVSRQPELGHPKYIQHALKNHQEELWAKLSSNAKVYICGDELTMVKEVNDLFIAIISENMLIPAKEAGLLYQQWTKEGRIVRDIWI